MRNVFLRNVGLSTLVCLCLNVQTAQAAVKLGSYYGKWASTAIYAAGDVVTFSSKTYISLALKAWEVLWAGAIGPQGDEIGLPGAKGDTGPQGPAGGGFNYSMTCGKSGKDACKVGAVGPGGGWIFFVDKDDEYPGFTYLEAAPTDIAAVVWCDKFSVSIYATPPTQAQYLVYKSELVGVGKGKSNTKAMVAFCNSGAANEATNYSTPTAPSGWFLPSLFELMLMYENLLKVGVGVGIFAVDGNWSSTEGGANGAWKQGFDNFGHYNNKSDKLPVRAVRAF